MVKVAIERSDDEQTPSEPRLRKSRWKLKLFLFGTTLFASAPSLLSLSGQVPALLTTLHPRLADVVTFQSITLHWWAPVEVRGLQIRDASIEDDSQSPKSPALLTADHIVTIEPLWRLVLNAGRGIGIQITSPRLNMTTDDHGTNLDRTLAHVFGNSSADSSAPFPFRLTINNGHVQVRSLAMRESSAGVTGDDASRLKATVVELTSIQGTVSTMNVSRWLPSVNLSAEIQSSSSAPLSGHRNGPRSARLAAGLDEVMSDFPAVPLDELAGSNAEGDATASRIVVRLNPSADDQGRQTIQLGARGVDLRLVQPLLALSGIDVLAEGVISGGIDARLAGAQLADGIVGRMLLAGEGVRVRQSQWAEGEWLPLGVLDASGAIVIADDGVLVQDLNVTSDVARLSGKGELRRGAAATSDATKNDDDVRLDATFDLAKLTTALKRTLALHDDLVIESGKLAVSLRGLAADRASGEQSLLDAATALAHWQLAAQLDSLRATRSDQPLNVDSQTKLVASGLLRGGQPELSQARLTAGFGMINCTPDRDDWLVTGTVQPDTLWQQLKQFADIPQPGLTSELTFQSRVATTIDSVRLSDMQLSSSDVRLSSKSLTVVPSNPITSLLDGTVQLEGSGRAVRTLVAPWHDASWLAGSSAVVASVSSTPGSDVRLKVRLTPSATAAMPRPNVRSVSSSRIAAAESSLAIDEADIDLALNATDAGRVFQITQGTVKLPGLAALVAGTVTVPDDGLVIDLTADTTYDLDLLSRRWFTAESGVSLSGQGRDMFRLTGSPSAINGANVGATAALKHATQTASFSGSGAINWSAANLLGLQLGPASVKAAIDNNLLRADPMRCSLNGGELNAMPQYDLATSRLQLGTGSRIQNVQLTPELCREWLGYVAPMLADSAEVSGTVSARVERFLWDFNDANQSDVLGELTIHQAAAAPGSSLLPLLEIAELLHRRGANSEPLAQRSLTFPEQTVPVQVRQGAVIHEGLIMDLAGYRLKSSGAVGLNQQLQLTLDVPLDKSSATSSGRSVKIPVRGTVSRPQPDTSKLLQSLGTQKIQEKIGEQLDQKLQKGLGGLLDKL